MRNLIRIIALVSISLASLFATRSVLAFPPLPSSFYGTVKVNGAKVPDGTIVNAYINGQLYANALTQTYQGDSVYSLDVLGDDSSTTTIEGGKDGDTIVFRIGEEVANETGKWKSGTNINLNLSVSKITPQSTSIPTRTPAASTVPEQTTEPSATLIPAISQTATIIPGQTLEPTSVQERAATTTSVLQLDPPRSTALVQPADSEQTGIDYGSVVVNSDKLILIIGVIVAVLILLFILWAIFVRKPKA